MTSAVAVVHSVAANDFAAANLITSDFLLRLPDLLAALKIR